MLKNIYSVGQVNNYIKNMFAQDFLLHRISVKGEISNCKYHSSGHIYFTLKDSNGTLSAIMFASRRSGLKFQMKEGDNVVVTGSIEVYEKGGSYQIYADTIELDGEGNLYLKFEALKKELEEMGMFDASYKRPLPKYASRIGIVTAPTGAAVRDIQNIANRRNPYVQLILYPALVQGDGAVASICKGIEILDQMNLDIIIVGRGGGSIEDLWAFNEEAVARAIFNCKTPIISAVGHETDVTIADYVSDLRAPTPSAAAELAVFDYSLVVRQLSILQQRLYHNVSSSLEICRQKVEAYKVKLTHVSPEYRLNENRRIVADYEDRVRRAMSSNLEHKQHQYQLLLQKLEALSPMKKLSMGYALIEDGDHNKINSVEQIKVSDKVSIHIKDGVIETEVMEVRNVERG